MLQFSSAPGRIVSLVPSVTETLCDLGLEDLIVGVTRFCVHPVHLKKTKKIIGGTKNPNIKEIILLQPDLIIGNKEENRMEDIMLLKSISNVYVTDIKNLSDTITFISGLKALFSNAHFDSMISKLKEIEFKSIPPKIKTCYLIWKNPWMTVGYDTFIHYNLEHFGFINVFSALNRYPEVPMEQIKTLSPQLIMLSSEPYPFKENDIKAINQLCPESRVILVDGELFSWYGSRQLISDTYISTLYDQMLHDV